MRQSAQREADLTIREAQTRSHQMLADSSARIERVQDSYEALQEAKRELHQRLPPPPEDLHGHDGEHGVASAREIEASLRERLDTESIAVVREAAEEAEAPRESSDAADARRADGELTDPGLTVSDYEVASLEEEVSVSTETGEAVPDATRLIETGTRRRGGARERGRAGGSGRRSRALRGPGGAADAGPARTRSMGPLAGEPGADEAPAGEPEVAEPEVEPSTVRDETRQVDEPPVSEPEAAGEVEREEPALAEESSSQEFFDRDEEEQATAASSGPAASCAGASRGFGALYRSGLQSTTALG